MIRRLKQIADKEINLPFLRLPRLLLMSNIKLDDEHKRAVLAENAIEREWYEGVEGFHDLEAILAAAREGLLVKVEPTVNYLPIMRLRNPKLIATYPPFLTPQAKALVDEIGRRWRQEMNKARLDKEIRFALTSLIRTKPYQATIVKAGKLADPDSVHTRGEAFDIDASGYYLGEVPVNARTGLQKQFRQAFKDMEAELKAPEFAEYSEFRPQAMKLLKQVMEQMQSEQKLHFVHEFPDSTNDVFHACRHPEYTGE